MNDFRPTDEDAVLATHNEGNSLRKPRRDYFLFWANFSTGAQWVLSKSPCVKPLPGCPVSLEHAAIYAWTDNRSSPAAQPPPVSGWKQWVVGAGPAGEGAGQQHYGQDGRFARNDALTVLDVHHGGFFRVLLLGWKMLHFE